MRLAVLGSPTSWYLADLRRAAGTDYTIESATFRDLCSGVTTGGVAVSSGDLDLCSFDAVLVRTMPPGSLEQVVFRMDALAQLEASGVLVINPPKAIEASVDKYLATARLQRAGLKTPDSFVCQSRAEALEAFRQLGGEAVLKPLFGGEGRGIARLSDDAVAERAFQLVEQLGGVIYLQRFIEHEGADLRLMVLGDKVLGMRRSNPLDWRTNVSRGAQVSSLQPEEELTALARRAAAATGAIIAGVDILPGRDGELYVLEVNASPGWQALSRATGADVSRLVLDLIAKNLAPRGVL